MDLVIIRLIRSFSLFSSIFSFSTCL